MTETAWLALYVGVVWGFLIGWLRRGDKALRDAAREDETRRDLTENSPPR